MATPGKAARRWSCRSFVVSIAVAGSPLAWAGGAAAVPTFFGLGDLPPDFVGGGFFSAAVAVSADGTTVVGIASSLSSEAFRWTSSGGMVGLGDLPGASFYSSASGVSADGAVVVGRSASSSSGDIGSEGFRWTSSGGMQGLGDLPPSSRFYSEANGISDDGTTIVGASGRANIVTELEAFRWTSSGGMEGLGYLEGPGFASAAHAASADGSVIVGSSEVASGFAAFRWTSSEGMVGLGNLPDGYGSGAESVSADGATIVGTIIGGTNALGEETLEAFRWTSDGGMVGLGDLPGGDLLSRAHDVSADGSVVVGSGHDDSGFRAMIWDEANGMRRLDQVLVDLGLGPAVAGWDLDHAYSISADGMVIVGSGRNPSGQFEAWYAVIPEPGTSTLVSVGLLALAAARRRARTAVALSAGAVGRTARCGCPDTIGGAADAD